MYNAFKMDFFFLEEIIVRKGARVHACGCCTAKEIFGRMLVAHEATLAYLDRDSLSYSCLLIFAYIFCALLAHQ